MQGLIYGELTAGLQHVLTLRQQQHVLTATNLANSETPGFKAKVMDFEHTLKAAMSPDADKSVVMKPTVTELEPTPWSTDGNSVLPEREQARLRHNALMYRAVARGLSGQLAMLKYAANDGR